ncbi:MAG: hypothetical protein C0426_01370 [Rhodobacter sp.]|nr:hypothetical protein [Rhodobacter sp.]
MIDLHGSDDSGLIETPESSGRRAEPEAVTAAPEAAPKEERARRARGPRKPKSDRPDGEPPKEAAE